MQRPCFAVAILLASMATSVLVVGKVQSQSQGSSVSRLPSPRVVCGGVAGVEGTTVLVLGQSDDEVDRWLESLDEFVESDRKASHWFEVAGTGYDAAYDFAMHDGQYEGITRSTVDIEHSLAAAGEAAVSESGAEGDGTSELERYFYEASTYGSNEVAVDAEMRVGGDAATAIAVEWIAGRVEEARDWLVATPVAQRLVGWWEEGRDATWMVGWVAVERDSATMSTVELYEFEMDEPEVEAPYQGPDPVDFGDEVLLITAADTLDSLSARLEEAAQQLRFWAATRMVHKSQGRRVAQRAE